jgi:hypothetical protein
MNCDRSRSNSHLDGSLMALCNALLWATIKPGRPPYTTRMFVVFIAVNGARIEPGLPAALFCTRILDGGTDLGVGT